jgi:hypothetical protein
MMVIMHFIISANLPHHCSRESCSLSSDFCIVCGGDTARGMSIVLGNGLVGMRCLRDMQHSSALQRRSPTWQASSQQQQQQQHNKKLEKGVSCNANPAAQSAPSEFRLRDSPASIKLLHTARTILQLHWWCMTHMRSSAWIPLDQSENGPH